MNNKYHLPLVIMILLFSAVSTKALQPKELQIKNRVAKFENVKQGDVIVATYELKNISDKTIIIDYVNPDCTCTEYSIDKKEIPQGGKAILKLTFNTTGRVGKQKLNAVIKANTETKFYKVICLVYIKG